jgi:hypothetical protein
VRSRANSALNPKSKIANPKSESSPVPPPLQSAVARTGIRSGQSMGTTDELDSVESPFHVKHLHATILNRMGLDSNQLSYFYGGLNQKLVGVEHVSPIKQII